MIRRKVLAETIPLLILWLFLSALLWSFVFNILTSAKPGERLSLFIDAKVPDPTAMAVELEKDRPAGIRMVKVHPFSYAMMDDGSLSQADLYIMREDKLEQYAVSLAPVPDVLRDGRELALLDGTPVGIVIRFTDDETSDWIDYEPGRYVLAFGANGQHLPGNAGAVDDAAIRFADRVTELVEQPRNK